MVTRRLRTQHYTLLCLLLFVATPAAVGQQDKTDILDSQPVSQQDTIQNTAQTSLASPTLPELINDSSEHFSDIDSASLDGLLERIGDSRLVLLGEASHGSAEFYDMRARITSELIEKKGFNIVAIEADWPDATAIDYFVRGTGNNNLKKPRFRIRPFSGYPSWMWANHSVLVFTEWLKNYNHRFEYYGDAVGVYGIDLYNLYSSIEAVLDYLHQVDPDAAEAARWAYGCLRPWMDDPAIYGRVMQSGRHAGCAYQVSAVLTELQKNHGFYKQFYKPFDGEKYFDALQNARLVKNGERYYRTMFDDAADSWNQRDQNMYDTLVAILNHRGPSSKAVIWAHNSHIGDSRATERSEHGEINLGQLVRETFGDSAYLIGFGTDHGTVAASSKWGAAMKVMQIPASHVDSYEHLFHQVEAYNFMLPLRKSTMRKPVQVITREKLLAEHLLRAIGTMYDPEDELNKHYTRASLPRQFDEYIWFDETRAVKPLR
jgi:protein-L-isoaspartate(D-aspartate) O-methyltransferase